MLIEAVEYEIRKFNKQMHSKDITKFEVGYVIYDSCYNAAETAKVIINTAINHIPSNATLTVDGVRFCPCQDMPQPYIIGVITSIPRYHTTIIANAFVGGDEKLISISEDSPQVNFDVYPNYFRMLNDDVTTFLVYEATIEFFKWKNIGLLLSDNTYGEIGHLAALKHFKNTTFCVSFTAYLQSELASANDVMLRLKHRTYLDATILWLTPDDSAMFFTLAKKHNIQNRTWIGGPLIANLPLIYLQQFSPLIIGQMLFITVENILFRETTDSNFTAYFWDLTRDEVSNRWNGNIHFSENFTKSDLSQMKSQVTAGTYTALQSMSHAVNALIFELSQVMLHNLDKSKAYLFHLYRKKKLEHNFFLTFTSVGDFGDINMLQREGDSISLKRIGGFIKLWDFVLVHEVENNTYVSSSSCHDECGSGFYPIFVNKDCCWICSECETGFIKPDVGNKYCLICSLDTEPNKNRTKCLPYQRVYPSYRSNTAYILYGLVSSGIILNIVTFVTFLKYRQTPVVRASNIPLSFAQLLAHALLFLGPLSTIGKVYNTKCVVALFLHGFFICFVQGIIFAKTVFLVMIFKRKSAPQNTIRTRSFQYSVVTTIQAIYCCMVAAVLMQSQNGIKTFQNQENLTIKIICGNGNLLLLQMIYVLFITLLCMVQAFRARKLPTFFNEAKYILYAAFGSFVISTMSGLLYNSLTDADSLMLLFHTMMFLLNLCNFTCIFGPKLWIILLKPEKNDVRVLQKALYASVKEEVDLHVSRAQRYTNAKL